MNENIIENKIDRLPMNLRMPFQIIIFEKMGIFNDPDRVLIDGKIISDYIDNIDNTVVRDLIIKKKFAEAADLLIPIVKDMELMKAA